MITILEVTDLGLRGRNLNIELIEPHHIQNREVYNKSSLVVLIKTGKVKVLKNKFSTSPDDKIYAVKDISGILNLFFKKNFKENFNQGPELTDEDIVEHFIKNHAMKDMGILNNDDDYDLYEE